MATIDITNLTGNDLFEALKSGSKIKTEKTKAPPKPTLESLWANHSLVLIIHQTTCSCCGHQYEVPNPHILLHRRHPTEGEHYMAVTPMYKDPETVFSKLPLIERVEMSTVEACQFCWNLGTVIEQARLPDEQLAKQCSTTPLPKPRCDDPLEDLDLPDETVMQDLRDAGVL